MGKESGGMTEPAAIAVVGMACHYPGARSPRELWENVLTQRQQFRRFREERMPSADYYNADKSAEDRTYGIQGTFLDGFVFDCIAHRVLRSTFDSTDLSHWLALEVATAALADAGAIRGQGLPLEKVGCIVGNSLTGEFTRANSLRLRWPFIERMLRESAEEQGLVVAEVEPLIKAAAEKFRSFFPATNEDTLAGALSNTIAGRICGAFEFGAGGYVVDGACSSSLLAICTAAKALENHEMDACLAGGVDISMDPFELVGFAKARALTATDMRVYDRRGDGFLPGEGCGFVLLKRLEDARAAGDNIYAVIRGWGISSDGKGPITAPKAAGQARAIRAAWHRAGRPDFVEGHGTGTKVGDQVELEAIASVLEEVGIASSDGHNAGNGKKKKESRFSKAIKALQPRSRKQRSSVLPKEKMAVEEEAATRVMGLTSLKSIIGHTKAAAGVGAFIKAAIAVNRRIVPPTAGCQDPNPMYNTDIGRALYPVLRGNIHHPTSNLKAGVSAMGIGGINAHVVLESYATPDQRLAPAIHEAALLSSPQDGELFVFGAQSRASLVARLQELRGIAAECAIGELADLSASLLAELPIKPMVRAAILAQSPAELVRGIDELIMVSQSAIIDGPRVWIRESGPSSSPPRLGFLCPGQGSESLNAARWIIERAPALAQRARYLAQISAKEGGGDTMAALYPDANPMDSSARANARAHLAATEVAQPAQCMVSLLWAEYLSLFGLTPSVVGGHSLGELSGLALAGALSPDDLMRLATVRGRLMAPRSSAGMVSLATNRATAEALVTGLPSYAAIANVNGPNQIVVAGQNTALEALVKRAGKMGVKTHRLTVTNGFHSALVDKAATALQSIASIPVRPRQLRVPVVSTVANVKPDSDMREHVARHARSMVDFPAMVEGLSKQADLLLEVGAGRVLSRLVEMNVGSGGLPCLPVESTPGRVSDFHAVLAASWVRGADINWEPLHSGRLIRPFIPPQERSFIVNPCERNRSSSSPIIATSTTTSTSSSVPASTIPSVMDKSKILNLLLDGVVSMTGFDRASLSPSLRLRQDLNLDSSNVSDIISGIAVQLGIADRLDPSQLSDRPLFEVAATLETVMGIHLPHGAQQQDAILKEERLVYAPAAASGGKPCDFEELIFGLVAELTGFDRASLDKDMHLRDDLNLDSIKAGELVATAMRAANVDADRLDPAQLSNLTVADIALALHAAGPATARVTKAAGELLPPAVEVSLPVAYSAPTTPVATRVPLLDVGPKWVRAFSLFTFQSRPDLPGGGAIVGRRVRLVPAETGDLGEAFIAAGALLDRANYDTLVVDISSDIEASVSILSEAVKLITPKTSAVCFIQHTGGRFSLTSGPSTGRQGMVSVNAFARSLSLERPHLAVTLIDRGSTVPARAITTELHVASSGFSAVGLDSEGRWGLAALPISLSPYRSGHPILSRGDLVLATGGAKGITAACVRALASVTGVRLALVGSTPPEKLDSEVLQNLGRLSLEGIEARYWSCDLRDADAVMATVAKVREAQGPIVGVIHGAGKNVVRRVEQVSAADALEEIAPKLIGARNLLRALESAPPRLFVALTSIIGVAGMSGNAWYALANDTLDLELARFCQAHPETSPRSLAYGVWDEVGMGVKLGVISHLEKSGIGALSVADGTRYFLDSVLGEPAPSRQVIITAHVHHLPTWPTQPLTTTGLRFLDGQRFGVPGVSTRVMIRLHPDRDGCIRDHVFHGTMLMPAVYGLEAMAQAAWAARGGRRQGDGDNCSITTVTDVSLTSPIVVPPTGTNIEMRAAVRDGDYGVVDCEVRAESTGFTRAHFSATIHFGHPITSSEPFTVPPLDPPTPNLVPVRDLYGGLLFQGKQFHRMGPIKGASDGRLSFTGDVRNPTSERWLLGDPDFRDSLLQAGQLLVPQDEGLPVSISKIVIGHGNATAGGRTVFIKLEGSAERSHSGSVWVVNSSGRCVEHMDGYEVHVLSRHPDCPPSMKSFDTRRMQAKLDSACEVRRLPKPALSYTAMSLQGVERPERRKNVAEILEALDPAASLSWDEHGKPLLAEGCVSIAHDPHGILIVRAESNIGCDIECIEPRDGSILSHALRALLPTLRGGGDDDATAVTRLWTIGEALFKVGGKGVANMTALVATREGDVVEVNAGPFRVLTFVAATSRGPRRVVAVAFDLALPSPPSSSEGFKQADHTNDVFPQPVPAEVIDIDPNVHSVKAVYTPSLRFLEVNFVVPFDESGSVSGKVPAWVLATWMGRLRELALMIMSQELRATLSTGRYAMVTEAANVSLKAEITALDCISARLWSESLESSSCNICFAFYRIGDSDQEPELVAEASQRFGWAEVLGHGEIRSSPFPPYLAGWLKDMQPEQDKDNNGARSQSAPVLLVPVSPIVARLTVNTTLLEGNVVGNVYYANYFKWPHRALEKALWAARPEMFRSHGQTGELLITSQRIDYLRETMPFDTVDVSVHLEHVEGDRVTFAVQYQRGTTRLALGQLCGRWITRDSNGNAIPSDLPSGLLKMA